MTNQKTPEQGGPEISAVSFSKEQVSAAAVAYNSFPRNYLDLSDLEKHEIRIEQALEAAASIRQSAPAPGGTTEVQVQQAQIAFEAHLPSRSGQDAYTCLTCGVGVGNHGEAQKHALVFAVDAALSASAPVEDHKSSRVTPNCMTDDQGCEVQ